MSSYSFIGWIPCLSGELFFSKTEHGLGSYDFFLTNAAYRDSNDVFEGRRLVASAVVDWQDSNFVLKPNSGLFRVVVVAESNSYKSLTGKLFLIEKNNLDGPRKSAVRDDSGTGILADFRKALNSVSTSMSRVKNRVLWNISKWFPRKNDEYETQALQILAELADIPDKVTSKVSTTESKSKFTKRCEELEDVLYSIETTKTHCCEFHINYTGITYLRPGYVLDGPGVGSVEDLQDRTLCRQSFYFLKYLLHKHSHHADENESLTTVHRNKNNNISNAEILIRDIKRGIVDAKRTRKFSDHDVSGIAAYGASLVASCESMGWFGGSDKIAPAELPQNHKRSSQLQFLSNIADSTNLLKKAEGKRTGIFSLLVKRYLKWLTPVLGVCAPCLIYLNIFSNSHKNGKAILNQLEQKKNACDSDAGLCNHFFSSLEKYSVGDLHGLFSVMILVLFIPLIFVPISKQWKHVAFFSSVSRSFRGSISLKAGMYTGSKGNPAILGYFFYFLAVLVMFMKRGFIIVYQPAASIIKTTLLYASAFSIYAVSAYIIFGVALPLILKY